MNKKQLLLQNEELNARLNEARQELQALHIRLSEAKLEQESRLAALERQTARCAELQAEVDFLKAGLAAGIAGSAAAKDDRAGNAAASNLVATHSPVNTLPIVDEETAEEPDADKQKNDEQAVEGPPEDVSAEEETAVNTPAVPAPKADMPADNTLTDNAQKGDAPRNNLSPDGETPLSESAPQARIPAFSENGLDFESYFNEPAAPAEKGEKTEQKSTEALAAESFIENAAPVSKGQPTNPEFDDLQPTDLQFTDLQFTDPQFTDPQPTKLKCGNPQLADLQQPPPHSAEKQQTEQEPLADPEFADFQSIDPQSTESQDDDRQSTVLQPADSQSAAPQCNSPQSEAPQCNSPLSEAPAPGAMATRTPDEQQELQNYCARLIGRVALAATRVMVYNPTQNAANVKDLALSRSEVFKRQATAFLTQPGSGALLRRQLDALTADTEQFLNALANGLPTQNGQ